MKKEIKEHLKEVHFNELREARLQLAQMKLEFSLMKNDILIEKGEKWIIDKMKDEEVDSERILIP